MAGVLFWKIIYYTSSRRACGVGLFVQTDQRSALGGHMASQPKLQPDQPLPTSPYCSDPNCQSCKELREMEDAIRLHRPLPIREGEAKETSK